jgi:hypothetical protein
MRYLSLSVLILFLCFLASCSSVTVNYDYDPAVDFSKYKTFEYYEGDPIPGDELAKHPLVQKRVKEALIKGLIDKGYEQSESGDPDFIVAVHAGVKERMQVHQTGGYYGGWYDPWWGPYGGTTHVSHYDEGTLVVDVVDAAEKDLIWRGLGTAIVKEYSNQEKEQKALDGYLAKILANFPPPKK